MGLDAFSGWVGLPLWCGVYIYIYMYIYVCVCVYVYIYIYLLPSPSHGVLSFLGFENLFAIYPSV